MNVKSLFAIQKVLDDRIVDEHQLDRDALFASKVLALQVELGELANETRCFKYWSHKPSSAAAVILEEYVDALHFVLSLGLDHGYTDIAVVPAVNDNDLIAQFLELFALITRFSASRERADYLLLFAGLLRLGDLLGCDATATERAYLAKNQENHRRQATGY
ncbi:MAG: dUTP diphosphatase [Tumebacillaceae bacterium]